MSIFEEQNIPGVTIERRAFLRVSMSTMLAFFSGRALPGLTSVEHQGGAALSWEELIEEVMPRARRLIASVNRDEEGYLADLSRLILLAEDVPRATFDFSRPVAEHESILRVPLRVVQFRMAPGATIPHHDHHDYIGALTVTAGQVRVRSYDPLPDPESSRHTPNRTFKIRRVSDALISKRGQSTLSTFRENIHELCAGPEGARVIDFFTLYQPTASSTYIEVSANSVDPEGRIFDATWGDRRAMPKIS